MWSAQSRELSAKLLDVIEFLIGPMSKLIWKSAILKSNMRKTNHFITLVSINQSSPTRNLHKKKRSVWQSQSKKFAQFGSKKTYVAAKSSLQFKPKNNISKSTIKHTTAPSAEGSSTVKRSTTFMAAHIIMKQAVVAVVTIMMMILMKKYRYRQLNL